MISSNATPHPASVAAAELREWLDEQADVKILDVRTPPEFESAHIPGAHNVPLDTLREHREELRRHLDGPVVLVCRSGNRAQEAERALASTGMPNLHVLDGGLLAWEAACAPVKRGRQRWDLERQVRLVAGLLVLGGIVGSVAVPRLKWLSAAVGGGLTGAALTNSCLMARLLSKLPYNQGQTCDVTAVIAQLRQDEPPSAVA